MTTLSFSSSVSLMSDKEEMLSSSFMSSSFVSSSFMSASFVESVSTLVVGVIGMYVAAVSSLYVVAVSSLCDAGAVYANTEVF